MHARRVLSAKAAPCVRPQPALASPPPRRVLAVRLPRRGAGSPTTAAAAAAAAGASAATQTVLRAATGVPLLESLHKMPLADAAARSLWLLAFGVIGTVLADRIVRFVGQRVDRALQREAELPPSSRRSALSMLIGAGLVAVQRPFCTLLPWFFFSYSSTIVAALVKVAAVDAETVHMPGILSLLEYCPPGFTQGMQEVAQLAQDTTEFVLIVFATWFFVSFKNRLVRALMGNAQEEDGLARIVYPLSSLLSWAAVSAGALLSLNAFGINIQPLLTVGSVSTLAIGFASQSAASNIVSAVSLYTSRPFIAGDRVQIKSPSSGSTIVAGTVLKITPLHTVINTDANSPVYFHNKDLATSMLILNESKLARAGALSPAPTVDASLTLRYEDVDRLPAVEEAATFWLQQHPDLTAGKCALAEFGPRGPVLTVKATLSREASGRKAEITSQVLREVERCVRSAGAFLAVDGGVALPPAPPPAAA